MQQQIKKVYLHWSATGYNWKEPGHYHAVITGDGVVHKQTDYRTKISGHTYARNTDAVALSVACMGNGGFRDTPPTPAQLDSMCKEAAKIALSVGWPADATGLKKLIMTHAEAAALRDYPIEKVRELGPSAGMDVAQLLGLPHDNYGPSSWHDGWPPSDHCERWDLWHLTADGRRGSGGFLLRETIAGRMVKLKAK